jgi:hypothetical protein
MVILARRPDPLQFAQWNRLPLMLAVFTGEKDASAAEEQDLAEIAGFMRELLVYCCLEPRVSETAAPDSVDEIHPKEIDGKDLMHILAWAMRLKEAASLRPFRRERTNDGAGGDSEDVRVPAVGTAGDRGPDAGAGGGPGGGAAGVGSGEGRG